MLLLALPAEMAHADKPVAPPGFNVHLVEARPGGRFWRGGAPRLDTAATLLRSARERRVHLTLLDLRFPPNTDDRLPKGGRLTPDGEKRWAQQAGVTHQPISALDPSLPARIEAALARGDVYLHCMYGVNRTGFAVGRWATARSRNPDRAGLGKRDWKQGVAFEKPRILQRSSGSGRKLHPTHGNSR